MGPLVIDFQSTTMTDHELKMLRSPIVGGVILFSRNFQSSEQLKKLTGQIRALRPDCLICVDHEGGRVQRFKTDLFTHLPAMGGVSCEQQAFDCGVIMAYELKSHNIHVNFAPVLDRDNVSEVIGDRGFANDPSVIVRHARALTRGMHAVNMPACGKHFPGHGSVVADSHIACPVDSRAMQDIKEDMSPFIEMINNNQLDAIMPAHVVFDKLDNKPAGYSEFWLQQVLREQLGFNGVLFSDDLSMQGASLVGSLEQRAIAAYQAGCDFLLLCNSPQHIEPVIKFLEQQKLRKALDCSHWFKAMPDNAESIYTAARERLISGDYRD
jgi:beta-N-acetylhexosaminidase